jgi:hypothetical protein
LKWKSDCAEFRQRQQAQNCIECDTRLTDTLNSNLAEENFKAANDALYVTEGEGGPGGRNFFLAVAYIAGQVRQLKNS